MRPIRRKKIRGLKQIDARKFPSIDWLSLAEITDETGTSDYRLRRSGLKRTRIGNADHAHIRQYNAWARRPDLPIPSVDALQAMGPEPQYRRLGGAEPEQDIHV